MAIGHYLGHIANSNFDLSNNPATYLYNKNNKYMKL